MYLLSLTSSENRSVCLNARVAYKYIIAPSA